MQNIGEEMLMPILSPHAPMRNLWSPRADVYETDKDLVVKFCFAGLDPLTLDISLSPDRKNLTVRGVRTEFDDEYENRLRYYRLETHYGAFERVVEMPDNVVVDGDALTADYKNGFLKIKLPKKAVRKPVISEVGPV